MNNENFFDHLPYGLMELNACGVVRHYSPADDDDNKAEDDSASAIVGCNLFTDVAPIAQVTEFRERFEVFVEAPLPTEVFNLTFNDNQHNVQARIMLAQGDERDQVSGSEKSVLVMVAKA